jgi:serine/threonine protein phosphatase 1
MKTFVVGDVHGRRAQLRRLLAMLPRDRTADTLVLLGDLIDRGEDAPGVVEDVIRLCHEQGDQEKVAGRVVVLRGNHEQMLLDFIDHGHSLWLLPGSGGQHTYEQYTGRAPAEPGSPFWNDARRELAEKIPPAHLEFIRARPLYYEDDYAIYVHAGLDRDRHPRDTEPHYLLWTRDSEFFRNYHGKPCVFGHTPTPLLPLRGRLGHHGIYLSHSAIGLDTGYKQHSPLSCLSLPDFTLYQAYSDGREAVHRVTAFIPEELRSMRR